MTPRSKETLPPNLPQRGEASSFMPNHHALSKFPVTRYWHFERKKDIFELPPPGVPHWLRRFDWLVGWEHGWANVSLYPDHVYCHPNALGGLVNYLAENFDIDENRESFLVVGGEDTLLSSQQPETIERLTKYFKKIFYEAYDVNSEFVDIMPIGLQEFYLRGIEDSFLKLILEPKRKTHLLMSAFGLFWPHLNDQIDDRGKAIKFTKENSYISSGPFDRTDYFECLSSHKFMLCPLGNGIQAPKIYEAFLNRCIPIMTDNIASKRLVAKGAPILIVNEWSDITEEYLNSQYEGLRVKIERFFDVVSSLDKWWEFSFENPIK